MSHGMMRFIATLFLACLSLMAQGVEEVIYYHNDALGSPIIATDQEGRVVWRKSYAALRSADRPDRPERARLHRQVRGARPTLVPAGTTPGSAAFSPSTPPASIPRTPRALTGMRMPTTIRTSTWGWEGPIRHDLGLRQHRL
jgi:hypothetical protein